MAQAPPDLTQPILKPWEYLLNYREDTVGVVTGAPLTVVAIVALTAIAVWFAVRLYYKNQIENLESRLKLRDDTNNSLKTQLGQSSAQQWLHDVAEYDRTTAELVVKVLDCGFLWDLDTTSPFVSFEFTVFNGSVWPILLNEVGGFILYGKRRLETEPTLSTKWRVENIPHAYTGKVEVIQWLTSEEAATLRENWNQQTQVNRTAFHFTHLRLIVSGGANAEGVIPKPLRFHDLPSITPR
jgi:hypothetical protein